MSQPEVISIYAVKQRLNEFMIFDIRTPQEFAREHIPDSINVPLDRISSFEFSIPPHKKPLFLCKSGMRTQRATGTIMEKDLGQAFCLKGGIDSWKSLKLPVVKDRNVPIDVMRQVQIIAGTLILLGVVGSYFWSKYFLGLAVLVGCGQILAGVTGFCGMAKLLGAFTAPRGGYS